MNWDSNPTDFKSSCYVIWGFISTIKHKNIHTTRINTGPLIDHHVVFYCERDHKSPSNRSCKSTQNILIRCLYWGGNGPDVWNPNELFQKLGCVLIWRWSGSHHILKPHHESRVVWSVLAHEYVSDNKKPAYYEHVTGNSRPPRLNMYNTRGHVMSSIRQILVPLSSARTCVCDYPCYNLFTR